MPSALVNLGKKQVRRAMGIDCSTHALAFAIIENGAPVQWGRVDFDGATVFDRLLDARRKVSAVTNQLDFAADYIAFEAAILAKVSNADVTIKLSMVYGVCIAELMNNGTQVVTPRPLEWQSYIGNPNFTKKEKDALKLEFPGKSASWYSTKVRSLRKARTASWVESKWGHKIDDDNITDAMGLAWYAYDKLTVR